MGNLTKHSVVSASRHCLQGGHDAGDHPPITPIASATEQELGGGDIWRLYDYVARHFLGSLSPDCTFARTIASFSAGQEAFSASGTSPRRPGFTAIMPWRVGISHQLLNMHIYTDPQVLLALSGIQQAVRLSITGSAAVTQAVEGEPLPPIQEGESLAITEVDLKQVTFTM